MTRTGKILPALAAVLILLPGLALAAAGQTGPSGDPDPTGRYRTTLETLIRESRNPRAAPGERLDALAALARFHEETTGNLTEAERTWKALRDAPGPRDHPARTLAEKALKQSRHNRLRFMDQDAALARAMAVLGSEPDPGAEKSAASDLKYVLEETPGYDRRAEAEYTLGALLKNLGDYGPADEAFSRALALKPGLDLFLPASVAKEEAARIRRDQILTLTAWILCGFSFLTAFAAFLLSRPWQWARPRHLILGAALALAWCLVFHAAYHGLSDPAAAREILVRDSTYPVPDFVGAGPDDPGQETPRALFFYGLAGTLALFFFSLGAGKIKKRLTRMALVYAFSWLLFLSLAGAFYMKQVRNKGFYESGRENIGQILTGNFYMEVDEPEPFIIMEPWKYKNLQTEQVLGP